jgi:hypothetical protein
MTFDPVFSVKKIGAVINETRNCLVPCFVFCSTNWIGLIRYNSVPGADTHSS